jgi:hypothetical protein
MRECERRKITWENGVGIARADELATRFVLVEVREYLRSCAVFKLILAEYGDWLSAGLRVMVKESTHCGSWLFP